MTCPGPDPGRSAVIRRRESGDGQLPPAKKEDAMINGVASERSVFAVSGVGVGARQKCRKAVALVVQITSPRPPCQSLELTVADVTRPGCSAAPPGSRFAARPAGDPVGSGGRPCGARRRREGAAARAGKVDDRGGEARRAGAALRVVDTRRDTANAAIRTGKTAGEHADEAGRWTCRRVRSGQGPA